MIARDCSPRGTSPVSLVVILIALSAILSMANVRWPLDDFIEYWAAGRLNAAGINPYDSAALLQEQARAGWAQPKPVMMYNPPWTLALAMPAGALDFGVARSIWLSMQIVITLWCASRLWMLYEGAAKYASVPWFLALLWFPTLIAGRLGQFSTIVLLGLVGFVVCASTRRDFAAGMFLALTAVKPQLVAVVWFAVFLWAVADRRFKLVAGVGVILLSGSIAAVAANPAVFDQYLHLMTLAPPAGSFESPNVGTVLRAALGTQATWPQYVPTVCGAIAVAALWYRRRTTWEWRSQLPGLVLLSCLVTSYGGWTCDLVVLLVAVVAAAAAVSRADRISLTVGAGTTFGVVTLLAFVMHTLQVPEAGFIWMTPVVTIAWLAVSRTAAAAERSAAAVLLPAH
jgi:hypothetical protein